LAVALLGGTSVFMRFNAIRVYDCTAWSVARVPVERCGVRHLATELLAEIFGVDRVNLHVVASVGHRDISQAGVDELFCSLLALGQNVAASTQDQALAAVLFLYERVLAKPLDRIEGVVRARVPKRLPVLLTRDEAGATLATFRRKTERPGAMFVGGRWVTAETFRSTFVRGNFDDPYPPSTTDAVDGIPEGRGE
jgi:hypothetical protein